MDIGLIICTGLFKAFSAHSLGMVSIECSDALYGLPMVSMGRWRCLVLQLTGAMKMYRCTA